MSLVFVFQNEEDFSFRFPFLLFCFYFS